VLRASVARVGLTPAEWRQFTTLRAGDDEVAAWLFGRLAAKDIARARWWRPGESIFPGDLEVEMGDPGHAVVCRGGAEPVRVVLTHLDGAVAVTTPAEREIPSNRLPSDCFEKALT
jgi:hypothetical protein